ncbi:hypothetical protein ABW19_dt0204713 [Dactylella cylindrospora]|nr:hypothetical protein ABW19_dt0204713 [Dactylella cylindrospora]
MSVFKPGNVALITGGGSGIGAAIAKLCLSKGMNVAIIDQNPHSTREFVDSARSQYPNATIDAYIQDVSKLESWSLFIPAFKSSFKRIDLLVLNAAVGPRGGFKDVAYFQKTFEVNIMGYVNGIASFYDEIRESSSESPKAVVLTGSKQGITNPPGNPAYNASKAAVKSIAEGLSFEFRNTSTNVHLLVPGWTFTGLTGGTEKPAGAWAPEQVADYMLQKMSIGEFYIICPDNEVDEETDKKRMRWGAGDITERRPPLSRWREDWKERAAGELRKK